MSDDESYDTENSRGDDSSDSENEIPTTKNPKKMNQSSRVNANIDSDDDTEGSDENDGDDDESQAGRGFDGADEEDDADVDADADADGSQMDDDASQMDDDEPEEDDDEYDDENLGTAQAAAVETKKPAKPKKTTQLKFDYDDEEDEYEENYLQKFDNELNKNYISEFHPECLNHSSDEIEKLANVVRDEYNNIIDPLHKTLPYLTKYEKARILGQRAKQIETGAKPLVKVPENIIDGYIIAELELREKKIPFIIKRPIPGGAFEYWHLRDLENIHF
jgi:DNA-directed RNA polymerase I, II, and III subunit RPABC2